MAEIKFCGLTRAADAEVAGSLGASYLGVIFAGGPRLVSMEQAREILGGCGGSIRRVGVFAGADAVAIARAVETARLHVVQLHGDPTADDIAAVRGATGAEVWAVARIAGALPPNIDELFDAADAVLLDAKVDGRLGGTGVAFDWSAVAPELHRRRRGRAVVLAGGLHAGNVGAGLQAIGPDVVDVSSGVEMAPGIKDHARMRDFAAAVRSARAASLPNERVERR